MMITAPPMKDFIRILQPKYVVLNLSYFARYPIGRLQLDPLIVYFSLTT